MKFSPEFLGKIKAAVNLIELVGEHVVLKKSGSNYSGLCPFHSERSPSFSVSEPKQLYHCYGCQRGGDLFGFVMEMHGLSFPEAVESLAERARIVIPESERAGLAGKGGAAGLEQREKATKAFRLNRFAAAFFHQQLSRDSGAQAYLTRRGVSAEMQRDFYVGLAPSGWDGLTQHMVNAKAPLDVAAQLGLIRPSPAGKGGSAGFYDLFRARVIFPILDLRGRVVGFGGRTQGDEQPKYLNSSESFLFQKSKVLFGLMQAQKHIREKDEAIVVEGYFDVIALHAAGFRNVVATCGTSLTAEHLQVLKRWASRVVLFFDADRAGRSATTRAMELGLTSGWVLHGAEIPTEMGADGKPLIKDPDELVLQGESGVQILKGALEQAQPLLDRSIRELWTEAQSADQKTAAIKQIAAWLQMYTDPVGRAVRVEQLQKEYGISAQILRSVQMGGGGPVRLGAGAPQPHSAPVPRTPGPARGAGSTAAAAVKQVVLSPSERILLRAIAWGSPWQELVTAARDKMPPQLGLSDLFDTPGAHQLLDRLANEAGFLEKFRQVPHTILDTIEDRQVRSILTEIWMRPAESDAAEWGLDTDGVALALGHRLKRVWARFSHTVLAELKRAEAAKDAESLEKWNKEYLDVKRKMMELVTFYGET